MAYRELGMIEVRVALGRFTPGEPVRAIARGIRVDRKTVVIPRHPRGQPLRVSLTVSAAGSPDRPRQPGSGA